MIQNDNKPKLLLHICCVGCGVYISQLLQDEFEVILFFNNDNIWPEEEYNHRLEETKKIAEQFNLKLLIADYDHASWIEKIKGFENEPEKGKRCEVCYKYRLRETAQKANKENIKYFTTTLSTSPHKSAEKINLIGENLAKEFNINFLSRDFKKQDGFKKSTELSRKLGLYRQNYCGCEFSRKL